MKLGRRKAVRDSFLRDLAVAGTIVVFATIAACLWIYFGQPLS